MNSGQIIKSKSTERFTVIPNGILEDKRISLKAIGLLCYILRLPSDWVLHKSRLHANLKDGRDAVINAFNELQDCGYIETIEVREGGRFHGFNYIVSDKPNLNKPDKRKPITENPETAPVTEKPEPVLPKSEKAELLNTNSTNNYSLSFTNVNNNGAEQIPLINEEKKSEERKPPRKKSDKPKTHYQEFIDIFSIWFKELNEGTPPRIDGAQGNAAKSLIGYFKQIVKARAELEKVDLTGEYLEAKTLEAWRLVLDSWHFLDNFLQNKTRLTDINSNIQNIIKAIKDAARTNGTTQQKGNSKKVDSSGIKNMFAAVDGKYGQPGGN